MAKNRMVSTSFWSDHYVSDLDPTEKLLFLYLLTNERSTLAGVYELPIKMMAVETGIDVFMVEKILSRFEDEGKVKYQTGWVAIKNFLKHHEHGSPTVKKGIEDAIKAAPDWARTFVGKGIDTLTPSSSSLSSASISAPREEVFEEDENAKPKREKKDTSYLQVYELFYKKWPAAWRSDKTQIQAAKNLLEERGLEEVKNALKWYADLKHLDFCPDVSTPWGLDSKWIKFEKFVEKQEV